MIEEWKIRTGYGDFRRDCTVERDDGLDINAYIEQRINVCYRKLLREAPFALLPIKNFAGDVKMQVMPDLSGFIALPNNCLRVSEIRVSGWKRMVKSSEFAVGERLCIAVKRVDTWWLCQSCCCRGASQSDRLFCSR